MQYVELFHLAIQKIKFIQMKKFLFTILLSTSICATAQITSASLTASGLTCSMCSKAIYKSLLQVPAVKNVQVDIKNSTYNIQFKQDTKVALDNIKKAVIDAGFSVSSLQVTINFDTVEIANDTHIAIADNWFHFLAVDKQILTGSKTFTVVDKNYLPGTEFKKYSSYTTMQCIKTGTLETCCPIKAPANSRVYHITL